MKKLNILLAYVSFPITTAIYFDKALRKNHNLITMGVKPDLSFNQSVNVNLESTDLDILTDMSPDLNQILIKFPDHLYPDLFIWVESVPPFFPTNLDKLTIPKVAYFIDSHLNLENHLSLAKQFDFVFIAQCEYLNTFRERGINTYWLPLACDEDIHYNSSIEKLYDIAFVGSTNLNPRRKVLLDTIKTKNDVYEKRCFLSEMAKVFSNSKLVFNSAVKNDLNMRIFEGLCSGSLLFTDLALKSNQEFLFKNGEDLVVYKDNLINNVIEFYLENNELRKAIAQRGRELVLSAHTYSHRINDLLNVVIGNKTTTFTAEELRQQSITNASVTTKHINKLKRTLIIPVIDYSPASPYNIVTLLKDLESIEGNVIIIFNSEKVANEIKNNPRIDSYAIMKKNVGVSRAWNIGLEMSDTPITFILNSDLSIKNEAVEKLENALIELDNAAMVGPQGSYNNFFIQKDFEYFDKGSFNEIKEVDAVSGFFFAVKTKYFHDGLLKFETKFTPCYFEEWDIGLQIKKANLKSYIIPCTEYNHEWSGSIRSMRTIKYLDKEDTAQNILDRNSKLFNDKWINLLNTKKITEDILESIWLKIQIKNILSCLEENRFDDAYNVNKLLLKIYPHNKYLNLLNNKFLVYLTNKDSKLLLNSYIDESKNI